MLQQNKNLNGIPYMIEEEYYLNFVNSAHVIQIYVVNKGFEGTSFGLSLGAFVNMSLLHGTSIDEFPAIYRDDMKDIVNSLRESYNLRRRIIGRDEFLFVQNKETIPLDDSNEDFFDMSVFEKDTLFRENEEFVDLFMNFEPAEDLAQCYGSFMFDNYIDNMSSEAKDILSSKVLPFTMDEWMSYEGLFHKKNLIDSYFVLNNLQDYCFREPVVDDGLCDALMMLNVFLFLRKERPENMRILTLLKAGEDLEIPFMNEAYIRYLKKRQIKNYIGSSLSRAMYVSVIEDDVYVDAIIESHMKLEVINDYFIALYDEDELQDLPFCTYYHRQAFPPNYQYHMNKYMVFSAVVDDIWDWFPFIVVEHGEMSNLQLIRMMSVSRSWYSVVRNFFLKRTVNKNWIPELAADKGYPEYKSKCMFHYDCEDCSVYDHLEPDRDDDIVTQLHDMYTDCFSGFIGKLSVIDLKLYSLYQRYPKVSMSLIIISIRERYGFDAVRSLFRLNDVEGICDNYIQEVLEFVEIQAKKDVINMIDKWKMPQRIHWLRDMDMSPAVFIMRRQKDRYPGDDIIDDDQGIISEYIVSELKKQEHAKVNKVCLCYKDDCPVKECYYCQEDCSSPSWAAPKIINPYLLKKRMKDE